jgi:hypothetical protein
LHKISVNGGFRRGSSGNESLNPIKNYPVIKGGDNYD